MNLTNEAPKHWGTTSRPKQRQQVVHLSDGPPRPDQRHGNKSYFLEWGHRFEAKATATNRTSQHWRSTSSPQQRQQIVHLRFGAQHPEKKKATNRASKLWDTTSRPKQQQKFAHPSIGAALGGQSIGNKSYISALGHHFENQGNVTKSYILVLGHRFEAKATTTNRTS